MPCSPQPLDPYPWASRAMQARSMLTLTAVPRTLPCREGERAQILEFVEEVLQEGGCQACPRLPLPLLPCNPSQGWPSLPACLFTKQGVAFGGGARAECLRQVCMPLPLPLCLSTKSHADAVCFRIPRPLAARPRWWQVPVCERHPRYRQDRDCAGDHAHAQAQEVGASDSIASLKVSPRPLWSTQPCMHPSRSD